MADSRDRELESCILELRTRVVALDAHLEAQLESIDRVLDLFNSTHSKLATEESLAADHIPEAKPPATDRELGKIYDETPQFTPALRAIYDLGRKHGAVAEQAASCESTANDDQISSSTPDGGLVEMVAAAITPNDAIREVADWLEQQQHILAASWTNGCIYFAELLRHEADR
jgi:hypothetical protein